MCFQNKEIRRLKRDSRRGDSEAMFSLGMHYIDGKIVKQDKLLGNKLIKQSAEKGYMPAKIYLKGKVITDTVKTTVETVKNIADNLNK